MTLIPEYVRRSWPWILWRLWKNRNKLFFEGLLFCPLKTVEKLKEDTHEWFFAQAQSLSPELDEHRCSNPPIHKWEPPDNDWVKCNIGSSWSGKKRLVGGSWVLRNQAGVVLLHSRKAFSNHCTKNEAMLSCVTWAIESMHSHKYTKVIFAFEKGDLLSAFVRPKA